MDLSLAVAAAFPSGVTPTSSITKPFPWEVAGVPEHLSDGDIERIAEFAETPVHQRSPDLLVPDDSE